MLLYVVEELKKSRSLTTVGYKVDLSGEVGGRLTAACKSDGLVLCELMAESQEPSPGAHVVFDEQRLNCLCIC